MDARRGDAGAVGMRHVAERAGVSVGTVSNALNHPEKVSPDVLSRIRTVIAELGYVRNDAARVLRAGRSSTIGLVVLDVRNPFFTDLARGAEDEAVRHGLSVILGNSDEDAEREAAYLALFEEQRVQGVLISPLGEIDDRLERLRARGIGAVLVDRASSDARFSSVAVDDVAGGRMAVEHLLDAGRRRIAFVGGPVGIRQVADRLTGARQAIAAAGQARLDVVPTAALTVLEGRRAGLQLLAGAERPDAVFAVNDLVATGMLQAFVMDGSARVPDDIALIGYDDIDFASAAMVPLSSVRQPTELIGRTAVAILLEERAADVAPRQVVFQPELIVRASTGGRSGSRSAHARSGEHVAEPDGARLVPRAPSAPS